jgi:2-succinyl-5-enolpyruvyl-6-hydroxy-3-cyclohexene-1-carboxylate synthase
VIVAGAGSPDELPELAASAQLPLLADPLSGARRGPAAIAHYDLVLRDPTFAAEQAPRFVLRFGDLPTSKPLRTWLASLDATQLAIGTQLRWQDPDSVVAVHAATVRSEGGPEPDWLEAWRTAEARAAAAIVQALDQDGLSEPLVALRLGQWLPSEATLFVASSMPVRDVEAFFPVLDDPPRVLSNRGANGIDGTVSSAFGAAAAGERPVVLLIGDVALAHDVGGLLAAHRLELPITIVLLNNDGGGIFHFLAVANETDVFEDHVATPTGLDFSEAASLYGCEYRRPATVRELEAALHEGLGSRLTTIIEVRTDRRDNLALHRRLSEAVVDALSPPAAAELPPA